MAVAIGIMVLGYSYVQMRIGNLEADKQDHNKKLATLKKKNKEINKLKDEVARLQKQVDTIEKLTKIRDTPAPFMAALSVVIPDDIFVKSLEKRGKSFSLDGEGPDNTTVVNFVKRLQKLGKEFTPENPWRDSSDNKSPAFFTNVKLVQVFSSKKGSGRGSMNFKVTGNMR